MTSKLFRIGLFSAVFIFTVMGCTPKLPDVTDPPQAQAAAIKSQGGVYKVGNPYKILGRWYYPKEDYSYSEVGMASWYGPDFHAKTTANGESYNMHALTAAHRTLPLPSIVKVTNLENGRSLVVRVNDRGPYARDRIIDLSKKSAQLLGFHENGTAKVRVEILEKESRNLKAAMIGEKITETAEIASAPTSMISRGSIAPMGDVHSSVTEVEEYREDNRIIRVEETTEVTVHTVTERGYYVQAGAFSNPDAAKNLSIQLGEFGSSKVTKANVNGKTFYRVRVGPYNNRNEAEKCKSRIVNYGIPAAHIIED